MKHLNKKNKGNNSYNEKIPMPISAPIKKRLFLGDELDDMDFYSSRQFKSSSILLK